MGRVGQPAFNSWTFCIVALMMDSTSIGRGRVCSATAEWRDTVVTLPRVWRRLCHVWKRLDPFKLNQISITSFWIRMKLLDLLLLPWCCVIVVGSRRDHDNEGCYWCFCNCWNIGVKCRLPRFPNNIIKYLIIQHQKFAVGKWCVQYAIN